MSFGADEDEDGGEQVDLTRTRTTGKKGKSKPESVGGDGSQGSAALDPSVGDGTPAVGNVVVNASVAIVPRAVTKAALRREAAERETLRKEFLAMQVAVKATEVAVPFVFYDGTNIPGGTVRVKKGDSIWAFLDKSRKVGAQLRVGGQRTAKARRAWARVSVDDLIMVRGSVIIPHVSLPSQ